MSDPLWGPDVSADDRASHILTLLYMDNPARCYRTIQLLQDGRLRDAAVRALRELRDTLGSTEAAADAVGVTRQAATELLGKAGVRISRPSAAATQRPAYAYGVYLAAIRAIADAVRAAPVERPGRALEEYYDLEPRAVQSLTLLPAVAKAGQRWLQEIRAAGRPEVADARAAALDDAGAVMAPWVAARSATDPHLTVAEQADVYLGYHQDRARQRT